MLLLFEVLHPLSDLFLFVDFLKSFEECQILIFDALGHMGVQILRTVSAARLVAADINEAKLQFARKHGAVATVNTRSENATEEILAVSGSRKGKAVFDFVGIQSTIDLAVRVATTADLGSWGQWWC